VSRAIHGWWDVIWGASILVLSNLLRWETGVLVAILLSSDGYESIHQDYEYSHDGNQAKCHCGCIL
jgi:hypothetical protein